MYKYIFSILIITFWNSCLESQTTTIVPKLGTIIIPQNFEGTYIEDQNAYLIMLKNGVGTFGEPAMFIQTVTGEILSNHHCKTGEPFSDYLLTKFTEKLSSNLINTKSNGVSFIGGGVCENYNIGELNAMRYSYSLEDNEGLVTFNAQYDLYEEDRKHSITYTCKRDEVFDWIPIFEKILKSIVLNERGDPDIGYINGSNVIIRREPTTRAEIMGSFEIKGSKVKIIDKVKPKSTNEMITNQDLTFTYNNTEFLINKGKAVKVISNDQSNWLISFQDINQVYHETFIDPNFLEPTSGMIWYRVQEYNGSKTGWVYGKFIDLQNQF